MNSAVAKRSLVAAMMLAGLGCGVGPASGPSPAGPSEFALSLSLSAMPDIISQDGVSTSVLTIRVRDALSQPIAGLPIRVDIMVEDADGHLVVADVGALSSRWLTTGFDGTAETIYLAPQPPLPGATADRIITLRALPVGTDYANAVPRLVLLRLLRPGIIRPPTRMVPAFTFSPSTPREFDVVYFDASSSSDPDRQIAAYSWQFGDGTFGTGLAASHTYEVAGRYSVVLTLQDGFGLSVSSLPAEVLVTSSPLPVARFTASPTDPGVGEAVLFNGAASTAPPGRRLVSYLWDLGDGTVAEGVAPRHVFQRPGTFTVVLTVTDDAGRASVASGTITVTDLVPLASFAVSPSDPAVGSPVVLNASASTAPPGRRLVAYRWDFGDATPAGSGITATHVFARSGTFTIVLQVSDDAGKVGVASMMVTVSAPPGSTVDNPGACCRVLHLSLPGLRQ